MSDDSVLLLREFKQLSALWLQKTKITAKSIDELTKALPNCKIEY